VWDRSLIIEGIGEQNEKRLVKIVFLNTSNYQPINILQTVHDEYLVCGNSDGTIRFYDFGFKLAAWFEDLNLSTVKSISFSKTEPRAANNNYDQEDAEKMYDFKCSDFLVTDDNALMCMLNSTIFEEIQPAKKKGFTIMHGFKSSISAIAVHPSRPLLAIAGSEGFILIWDYVKKGDPIINNYASFGGKKDTKDKNIKKFFTTMEFTPDGSELLIGQYNGYIQVLDPKTGEPKKVATQLRTSENNFHPITQLIISNDGKYFACCDVANCVSLFKKDYVGEDENKPMEW
jgi:WD40 repeat protein